MLFVICSIIYCCINLDAIKLSLDMILSLDDKHNVMESNGERGELQCIGNCGIFFSLNFVTLILKSSSGGRFCNILKTFQQDIM